MPLLNVSSFSYFVKGLGMLIYQWLRFLPCEDFGNVMHERACKAHVGRAVVGLRIEKERGRFSLPPRLRLSSFGGRASGSSGSVIR
jgi:hypothetical protein